MQTRMFGAVVCVIRFTPPNRAALGRWSAVRALLMLSAAGVGRGVCGEQTAKCRGAGVTPGNWASGGPRLTEFRSIGSCPMAVCAVGRKALSGATKGVAGVCGAHERPPGKVWRPGSGFGFRSSNSSVHPDARKLALECVSPCKHGGRLLPPGLPPLPCVRRTSARPRRRFRGCGCVRRVGGGRSSSARDAWSSLRGDQGASRISGSGGGAGQGGRALAGGRGCRVLREPIRGEGRHRSFQIPRDGAPLGFRAGRVELDQLGAGADSCYNFGLNGKGWAWWTALYC